jgi:hypothetical protein
MFKLSFVGGLRGRVRSPLPHFLLSPVSKGSPTVGVDVKLLGHEGGWGERDE